MQGHVLWVESNGIHAALLAPDKSILVKQTLTEYKVLEAEATIRRYINRQVNWF